MNNRSNVEVVLAPDACVDAERVAHVRSVMPDSELVGDLAEVFGLLADPGRLRLLAALLEGGEMRVCDLAAATGQSMSAASPRLAAAAQSPGGEGAPGGPDGLLPAGRLRMCACCSTWPSPA